VLSPHRSKSLYQHENGSIPYFHGARLNILIDQESMEKLAKNFDNRDALVTYVKSLAPWSEGWRKKNTQPQAHKSHQEKQP
jgi:hypothetical protein